MIIELLGVPGSGKSTYVNSIVKSKNNIINPLSIYLYNDSRIKQNFNKIKLLLHFMIGHPLQFFRILRYFKKIKFNSTWTRLKMFLYLFSIISILNKCQRKYADQIVMVDEGVNQVIWGFLYNSQNSIQDIFNLYSILTPYMSEEVRILRVSRETIRERLLLRNNKGGSELQKAIRDNNEVLDHSLRLLELIVEKIKTYKKAVVIYI